MSAHDWTYDHVDAEDGLQLLSFSDDEDDPVLFRHVDQAPSQMPVYGLSVSPSTPQERGLDHLAQTGSTTSGTAYLPSFSHDIDIITFSDDDENDDAPLPNIPDASIRCAPYSTNSAHSSSSSSSSHHHTSTSSSWPEGAHSASGPSTAATSKAPDGAEDEIGEGMSDETGLAGFERFKASEIADVLAGMESREIEYDPDMTEEQRRWVEGGITFLLCPPLLPCCSASPAPYRLSDDADVCLNRYCHRDVVISKLEAMAMSIMLQLVRCTAKLAPETSECEDGGTSQSQSQGHEDEEDDMDGDDENTQTQALRSGEGSFSGSQKKGKIAAVRTGTRAGQAKAKSPGVSIKLLNRNRSA